MSGRNHRLARDLSRLFQVLRVLCVAALLILTPAMLFAFFSPDSFPDGGRVTVFGNQVTAARPAIPGVLIMIANAFLVAGIILRGMMGSVADGQPFTTENVARLRTIAKTMGALFVFQLVTGLVVTLSQLDGRADNHAQWDLGLLLGALVVLVLAEVFQEGIRLREDSEGTI